MKELTTLDLSQVTLVNQYLTDFPPQISEHTFTNLFAWSGTRPVWLFEVKDTLVFLIRTDICRDDELVIFGPPVGKLSLAEVLTELGDRVIGGVRLTDKDLAGLEPGSFSTTTDRENSDYVYLVSDLAELAGRNYAKKRSHVKHCLNEHDCVFEWISGHNIDECRDLLQRWCQSRQCDLDPGLCGEAKALQTTLDHFDNFKLLGGAIRVDGLIQAFTIGERLNRTTAVCHFEKSMPEINGLGQLINQWFAKKCLPEFEFFNREQDLGIPGLRQAKESYHPDHMVEKFKVFRTTR
ncbi:MAG: phosphatidylglycerol lysyltransferase domain-containing protein [Thermodesulfobacteriota bacterium]